MVKDRAVKERLGALNRGAFRIYGGLGRWLARNDPRMLRIIDAVQWQADHFADIPVVIVACLRGFRVPFPPVAATSYYGSIYPSVQNLLLAARAAGLGAALITLPLWSTFLARGDRKSTRLNSSHGYISYAVFCLKKKTKKKP